MHLRFILFIVWLFSIQTLFGKQDIAEKPVYYTFIYENGEKYGLINPADTTLVRITAEISSKQKNIREVQLQFRTSAKITVKYELSRVKAITVFANNITSNIPERAIKKIRDVMYQTLSVIWDGSDRNPFNASFFYIQFHIGPEKSFGKYPYVQFKFLDHRYVKSTLWSQVNATSLRFVDL